MEIKTDDELQVEDLMDIDDYSCVDEEDIQKVAKVLRKKKKRNEDARIEFPDSPKKWVMSEVDLNDLIVTVKNLSVCTNLYESMVTSGLYDEIIKLLNHPNSDIVIECIDILREITEPTNIYELTPEVYEQLTECLKKKKMCHFLINCLDKIDEKESEESYYGVANIFNICENIFELENKLQLDLVTNSKLLFFVLKRIPADIKPNDSNCLYASEILVLLMLRINQFAEHVYNDIHYTMTILDNLFNYIATYRKTDPENMRKEERLLNCFQALGYLLLSDKAKTVFENSTGLELMVRLLKERKFLCLPSLTILAQLLDGNTICNKFVEIGGLKYLFCLFMLKNVKKKKKDLFQLEENMITIISKLISNCSGTFLERVINKFGEDRCEKIIRLLELRQKYGDLVVEEKKNMHNDEAITQRLKEMNIEFDEEFEKNVKYMELCDKGYFVYQLIDVILISLFYMNNTYICNNIHAHLYTRNIDIQSIFENILDYLERIDDPDMKKQLEKKLYRFLYASKKSDLFT